MPRVAIETNGIGGFLPGVLKEVLAEKNIACAVIEKHSSENKQHRILEAYDAIMAAKALYVHGVVRETPFLTEMAEWQESKKNNKDDGLDAVAGALSMEPMRFGRVSNSAQKLSWMGSGKPCTATSDFDV